MIHCADTPAGVAFDKEDILRWHTAQPPQGRGWSRPGYSMVWTLSGETQILLPFDADDEIDSWEISNGASGWNGVAKHFCYIGGKGNQDTRTKEQKSAMEATIKMLVMIWPDVKVIGHNQVNAHKYCPSYDVPQWAESIGIPCENIDYNTYYE